jgi:hypothetical protein
MNNKFDYSGLNTAVFDSVIQNYGWIVYENALPTVFVDQIKDSLDTAYFIRRKIQIQNGISANMGGTLHHLVEKDNFSLKFLSQKYADEVIRHYLGGNYILNSLGAVINKQNSGAYVQNIHRDVRTYSPDFNLMIQMMVLLDDFTTENGATYFLSGSQHREEKPEEAEFYAGAERLIAKKGSIVLFNSNLWHAAGTNYTNRPRRALTMAFTRPFFKQQMDYARMLGADFAENLNDDLKQIIGYHSRVPVDLFEYYQPLEKRMYQPGQG